MGTSVSSSPAWAMATVAGPGHPLSKCRVPGAIGTGPTPSHDLTAFSCFFEERRQEPLSPGPEQCAEKAESPAGIPVLLFVLPKRMVRI